METYIQTFTGKKFWPLAPRGEDVDIRDIAHALAFKCRFNGHCRYFYSVAEHSVRVSRAVEEKFALWGLMHDAGEAYLTDVGAPIKPFFRIEDGGKVKTFGAAEDALLDVIADALKFPRVDYAQVRAADLQLLATEARDLMGVVGDAWGLGVAPLDEKIVPVGPQEAEGMFLARWEELRAK